MAKVKVAMDWLAACAGCEMSVLDMDERLVGLLGQDRTHFNADNGSETSAKGGGHGRNSLRSGQQHH